MVGVNTFRHACSGHRIGTAEVESALVSHPKCAEAAVVGVEHEVCLLSCVCVHVRERERGEEKSREERTYARKLFAV